MTTQEERRQAIGQRIRDDLSRSVMPERKPKTLPPGRMPGGVAEQLGVGEWSGAGAAVDGGGIASPLTEPDASTREYWASGLTSSDGLFILPAIRVLNLTDANGAAVQIQLANPEGTP